MRVALLLLLFSAASWAAPTDTSMGNGAWVANSAVYPYGTVGWTGCYSSAPPPHGCVIQFLAPDASGKVVSAVAINGGVLSGSGATTQSDMDFWNTVDGQLVVVALRGRWPGYPPAFITWPAGIFWLGDAANWWGGVYLTKTVCPASFARFNPEPNYCVRVDDGYTPVWTQ